MFRLGRHTADQRDQSLSLLLSREAGFAASLFLFGSVSPVAIGEGVGEGACMIDSLGPYNSGLGMYGFW